MPSPEATAAAALAEVSAARAVAPALEPADVFQPGWPPPAAEAGRLGRGRERVVARGR